MNRIEVKKEFVQAVDDAMKNGAKLKACADTSEISERTIQRWKKETSEDRRKGSARHIPHKLTHEEKKEIIRVSCSKEFQDNYPCEIVAELASRGQYIASEASFYRVLREEKMLSHRRKSRAPTKRSVPRLVATKPDEVYSWDITWLKSSVSGIYYYLYMVVDIYSRRIVQWEIHSRESSEIAANMLRKLSARKIIRGVTLHSDNGAPMKGYSMLAMMQALNVTPSFSRPRVSTDNPYSESLFGTMKYCPLYPDRFESMEDAIEWVKKFVYWYNYEHMHSGISYVTPHQRHYGMDIEILNTRKETYRRAYERNPVRWSRGPKTWERKEIVYLNQPENNLEIKIAG